MRTSRVIGTAAAIMLLAGCNGYDDGEVQSSSAKVDAPTTSANSAEPRSVAPPPAKSAAATAINHRPTYEKIIGNSGVSLQWISFYGAERGQLNTMTKDGTLYLMGRQKKAAQSGALELNGAVVEVNDGNFIFDGTIAITGTPDVSRTCIKNGKSEFAITQNRKYFRLREFEWCDGLTDYVDIYF